MNLLLWRHASADETDDPSADAVRGLNPRGRRQAALVAAWLNARLPADYALFSAPALRAQQTAAALSEDYRTLEELAAVSRPEQILNAVGWPDQRGTVIVVSHQPLLGALAALLLFGAPTRVSIKKGGLWWIANRDREDRAANVLRAVVTPDLLIESTETRSPAPQPQRDAA